MNRHNSPEVEAPLWLTIDNVASRIRVSPRTIRRLVARSQAAGIPVPLVKLGRTVRFRSDDVDRWFEEVSKWQASSPAKRNTGSGGGRSTATSEAAPAPPSAPPTSSGKPSSTSSPSAATGNLKSLAVRLTSRR